MENVHDKQKLQTRKAVVSSPYGGEMVAIHMKVKMRNSNNSQRITVKTMKKWRVASPPSLVPFSGVLHVITVDWDKIMPNSLALLVLLCEAE